MYCLSLLWSVDVRMGLRAIIYLWVFLAIFSAVAIEAESGVDHVLTQLYWLLALAVVEATLVIVFRLSHGAASWFLHSHVAQWFVNENALKALYGNEPNNVLSPTKAGGFFLNANVAGAYLGMLSAVSYGVWMLKKQLRFFILSLVFLGAVYFSGSKAAIMIAFILSLSVLTFFAVKVKDRKFLAWSLLVVFLPVSLFFGLHIHAQHLANNSAFVDNTVSTFDVRLKIWGYALRVFPEHAFIGQGFGGWQKGFPAYAESVGLRPGFPPHNTIIYLWSQGGLLAALFGIAFILWVLVFWMRLVIRMRDRRAAGFALAGGAAFCFIFIQGMGTNYGLLGEEHMIPVLASLLALGYVLFKEDRGKHLPK